MFSLMGVGNTTLGLAILATSLFIHPTVFEHTGKLAIGYWAVFVSACILVLFGLVFLVCQFGQHRREST